MMFPQRDELRNTVLVLGMSLIVWALVSLPTHAHAAGAPTLGFFQEFYGSGGYTNPQAAQFLQAKTINGLTLSPPVASGMAQLANPYGAGVMLQLAGAAAPAGMSAAAIETQRIDFSNQATANPQLDFIWDLMAEWDQSGGVWVPNGRPSYSGLSKSAAHAKFINYYRQSYPTLLSYLSQPASTRPYRMAAITDYPPNTFYAYELGVDLCMLERGIDELSDLSTGIAFLRGAAQQYQRAWGIDLSNWRTSNDSATQYTNGNVLLGGWSASYLLRHDYAAFASGATLVQNEAATFSDSNGQPNPFAQATAQFADFALHRHPNVGTPEVSTAFLVDHDNGFDPKHGIYNQANAVWYQDIPYSSGDFMINNLLRLAYPNHWSHGLTPGAPFANASGVPALAGFKSYLAAGGDPRPYEPMPTTRWGDNLDIVTNDVHSAALSGYRVIVLLGDVHLDSRLRNDLTAWVKAGGILVMNSSQMKAADEVLVGVAIGSSAQKTAMSSRWLSNGVTQTEAPYHYQPVSAAAAKVLAVNELSDPLVTQNRVGKGEVFLTTPAYMQSSAQDQILEICTQLLDAQIDRHSAARIVGSPVEYVVNRAPGKIIVTVINNSVTDWSGKILVDRANPVTAVSEYVLDQTMPFSAQTIPGQVPAFNVRVFAIDFSSVSQH
jgi:hypothetical protein